MSKTQNYNAPEFELDEKVKAAITFLSDVSDSVYKETDVRKYLQYKRGLTSVQVDMAFRMHHREMRRRKSFDQINSTDLRRSVTRRRKRRVNATNSISGISERTINTLVNTDNLKRAITLLVDSRQADGYRLLTNFLETEKSYSLILECLENYYKDLCSLAGKREFQMTRNEIKEIFSRIPYLVRFHKTFYKELQNVCNIGKLFLRYFSGFKVYVEYMKDCKLTVDIIRRHILDDKLHKLLAQMRQGSRFKRDNMTDLLLVPLDRIVEYKIFLNTLHDWCDVKQITKFLSLAKAKRRIGRVSHYIERYKEAIFNRSEMNKVQRFLRSQCVIISPNRVILRRGSMIRRTTGWTARNKSYVFFLFNDILLWTTTNRELQNIISLENCEVKPSEAKNDFERKFQIISTGRRDKTLLLECTSKKQRNKWYDIVERAIAGAKGAGDVITPLSIPQAKEHGWTKELIDDFHEYIKPCSLVESKNYEENKVSTSGELDEFQAYDEIERLESFNWEESCTFEDQKLTDFEPFDDAMSQSSELEFDEHHLEEQNQSSCHYLSAFRKMPSHLLVEDNVHKRRAKDSYCVDNEGNQIPIGSSNNRTEEKPTTKIRQDKENTHEKKEDYSHENLSKPGIVIQRHKYNAVTTRQQIDNPTHKLCLNDL